MVCRCFLSFDRLLFHFVDFLLLCRSLTSAPLLVLSLPLRVPSPLWLKGKRAQIKAASSKKPPRSLSRKWFFFPVLCSTASVSGCPRHALISRPVPCWLSFLEYSPVLPVPPPNSWSTWADPFLTPLFSAPQKSYHPLSSWFLSCLSHQAGRDRAGDDDCHVHHCVPRARHRVHAR